MRTAGSWLCLADELEGYTAMRQYASRSVYKIIQWLYVGAGESFPYDSCASAILRIN